MGCDELEESEVSISVKGPMGVSLIERPAYNICWKPVLRGNLRSKDCNLNSVEGKRELLAVPFHGHETGIDFSK